jgi:hypothetical protein
LFDALEDSMKRYFSVACFLVLALSLWAKSPFLGTWVARVDQTNKTPRLTMTIQDAGEGKRLITYTTPGVKRKTTILTRGNGEDAPVLVDGAPTGQTMAISIVDDRHRVTVLKYQGKQTGTSRAEISADGKVMTVENEMTAVPPGRKPGKTVSYWDRQ